MKLAQPLIARYKNIDETFNYVALTNVGIITDRWHWWLTQFGAAGNKWHCDANYNFYFKHESDFIWFSMRWP